MKLSSRTSVTVMLVAIVFNIALALRCPAADVTSLLVVKGQLFEQTSTGAPVVQGLTPFVFNAAVELRLPGLVTNATITLPGNVTNALIGECNEWSFQAAFSNQPAMDAALGNGNYTLTAFTLHDGVRAPVLSLTNNQYPGSAPHVSNYSAAQSVNPYDDFTLSWDPFPSGTSNDVILVQVDNESGNSIFGTTFFPDPSRLNGLSNSVVIPAFHLPPGQTCQASIIFARGYQTTNNGVYPGVTLTAGYFKRTDFNLVTTDLPDTNQPHLINPHPSDPVTPVSVNSSIAFSFDEPMRQRQAIKWSSNLDPNKFDYVWSQDLLTVICIYYTNLPANTTITWELNPTNATCGEFEDLSGNFFNPSGGFPASGSFTTGSTGAGAKDVILFGCGKAQLFTQTNSAIPSVTNGFGVQVFADLSGIYTITNASVRTPSGAEQPLFSDPYDSGDSFGFEQEFPDQAALDAAVPNGNYVITLNTVHDGTRISTNNLGGTFPTIPHISNFNAAQAIDPNQNFKLTWDAFQGGTTSDFIQLSVEDGQGNPVFESLGNPGSPGALNGTNTSIVIPAGALSPGQTYQAQLFFAKLGSLDTNSYPGVLGLTFYARETDFSVATVVARPILSQATRISPTQFRFRVDGAANQNYTVQVATNLSTAIWTPLYVTNSPVNPFTVLDSTATNSRRFYRVLVGP